MNIIVGVSPAEWMFIVVVLSSAAVAVIVSISYGNRYERRHPDEFLPVKKVLILAFLTFFISLILIAELLSLLYFGKLVTATFV